MKLQKLIYVALFVSVLCISQSIMASGSQSSEKIMAKILVNLNHYPSANEKSELSDIINHSKSTNEQAVATAILNLEHSARSADKKQLKKVMEDNDVSVPLKDIAGIVYRLHHKPSSDDKKILTAIID